MTLNELANDCHRIAKEHGFWHHRYIGLGDEFNNPSIYGEKRDLMHSEIAEMTEAHRDGDQPHEEEEAADLLIRLLDYAGERGFDMDLAVDKKMKENEERPYRHGRKF